MKRFLFAALCLLGTGVAQAENLRINDLKGGMHSTPSPNKIPDDAAQYIQNFYTDTGVLAEERKGSAKADTTVLGGTKTVPGLWSFRDVNGNEWSIRFSSKTYYKNVSGQAPAVFGSTATVTQVPDAAINLGKIMFTNGTDPVWWFDGTSTGVVSGAPRGKLIQAWRNRFVIANITGEQSNMRFSQDGDGTNWTIGGNETDPFAWPVGGANDGEYIRCMAGYLDSLIIGRKRDLWAGDGFDQGDFLLRNISNQIGCLEDGTMKENENSLVWLSNRGIDEMQGRSINLISEPVRNLTDQLVKNTASQRSVTLTSGADFTQGTIFQNAVFLDTVTVSGRAATTFPEPFDALRDGTSGTKQVWQFFGDFVFSGSSSSTLSVAGGTLNLTSPVGTSSGGLRTVTPMQLTASGTTVHFQLNQSDFDSSSSPSNHYAYVSIATHAYTSRVSQRLRNYSAVYVQLASTAAAVTQGKVVVFEVYGIGIPTTGAYFTFPMSVDVYLATNGVNLTVNNTSIMTPPGYTLGAAFPTTGYMYVYNECGSISAPRTAKFDNVGVVPQVTGARSSAITLGSSFSTWGSFAANDSNATHYISTSSDGLTFGATTQLTNNATPTIATNTYAQLTYQLSPTTTTTGAYVNDTTLTWNEGSAIPPPTATVYDRRYWLSYTTNTATDAYQDRVLVWQRNRSWITLSGLNAASFTTWQDALYFGNSNSTGYVYKFDTGNTDDGASISSYILTKSYDLGRFHVDKDFKTAWLAYQGNSEWIGLGEDGRYDFTYAVDGNSTYNSLGTAYLISSEMLDGHGFQKHPFPLSGVPLQGRDIAFRLSKTSTNARWKLYDVMLDYNYMEPR